LHRRLRAVIFDFDGTLVDSLDAFVEAMAAAVEALGLPLVSREKLAELVRLPADQSLPMLAPSSLNDKSLAERLVSEYRRKPLSLSSPEVPIMTLGSCSG